MSADHKIPLVQEWFASFRINMTLAKSLDAVQPQCSVCSSKQGGGLSNLAKKAARAWALLIDYANLAYDASAAGGIVLAWSELQEDLCSRFGVSAQKVSPDGKMGVSATVLLGHWPLHGVRTAPGNDTCGWYVWSGNLDSSDPEFFSALHASHLFLRRPEVTKYLGLPRGWRFLVAPDYEDVWFDDAAL